MTQVPVAPRRIRMLMSGFCRELQEDIKHAYIPDDIVNLCSIFWSPTTKVLFHTASAFNLLDIETNKLSKITGSIQKVRSNTICYVKGISTHLHKKNKSYDGIIAIRSGSSSKSSKSGHLSIMLFPANRFFQLDGIKCKSIKSRKPLLKHKKINTFLDCGKYGIIYHCNGNLYKLLFSDVDINKLMCNCSRSQLNFESNYNSFTRFQYRDFDDGILFYLEGQNKIISIQTSYLDNQRTDTTHRKFIFPVFKLDSCYNDWNWTEIADLDVDFHRFGNFGGEVKICQNPYDINLFYLITGRGGIAVYEFEKNKWTVKNTEPISFGNDYTVYIQNAYSLCAGKERYFHRFDLRNDNTQWQLLTQIDYNIDRVQRRFIVQK